MTRILIILLCIFLPLGELLRFDFNNGIAITPLDFIAFINLVFILFTFRKVKYLFTAPLSRSILIFIGIALISLVINFFNYSLEQVATGSLYLLRFISYASFYITATRIKPAGKYMYAFFFSGVLFALLGIFQYFLYPNLRNLYYAGWDEHYYRLFSTFLDPNFAGIFLVLTFLLGFFLSLTKKLEKKLFYGLLCINLFLLVCIFLTFSRSAFLALFTGLGILFFFLKQSRKYILLGIGISLVAIIIIAFNYKFSEGTKLFRTASSFARIESLQDSWNIFLKNPIFGTGFNLYRYAGYKYGLAKGNNWETSHSGAGVENSFAFVLATTGILGLMAYLYLLYSIIRISVKREEIKNKVMKHVPLTMLVALIVDSFFVNSLFFPNLMIWMWVILGLTENM